MESKDIGTIVNKHGSIGHYGIEGSKSAEGNLVGFEPPPGTI